MTGLSAAAAAVGARTYATLDELLDDDAVTLVDVAIPPSAQAHLLPTVFAAGRHVMAQKPLAPSLEQAAPLVDMADAAGVLLGVNQQMRWSPAIRHASRLYARGALGSPTHAEIETIVRIPRRMRPSWIADEPRLLVLFNTLHFFDALRFLYGAPQSVRAEVIRDQRFDVAGEVGVRATVTFASGVVATVNEERTIQGPNRTRFRFGGDEGALEGSFGFWSEPPGPDELVVRSGDGTEQRLDDASRWMPDAFCGPLQEMVEAIGGRGSLSVTGRDHLHTLALVEACYTADATGSEIEVCV